MRKSLRYTYVFHARKFCDGSSDIHASFRVCFEKLKRLGLDQAYIWAELRLLKMYLFRNYVMGVINLLRWLSLIIESEFLSYRLRKSLGLKTLELFEIEAEFSSLMLRSLCR